MEDKAILQEAINRYGVDAQIDRSIEEMSELIQALLKNRIGRSDANVSEEMADVKITMEQLEMIFENADVVHDFYNYKIKRLKERLKL